MDLPARGRPGRRRALLAAAPPLAACATEPTFEQRRAACEAERTRRGINRLPPPEARERPECLPPGVSPRP